MKTYSAKPSEIEKKWILIDAENLVVGRLAAVIASRLRGKHLPTFTPHMDTGDHVIVINAEKINLTGNKWNDKTYIRHTGYPGGQRSLTATELSGKDPARLVEKSVKGMLPKNKLGSKIYTNLYVFEGNEHPHAAQKPEVLKLEK